MITYNDILVNSTDHYSVGGKITVLKNEKFILSIVGGTSGLYGDFVDDFELAVIDTTTKEFITRIFFSESNDDVMAYVPKERMVEIVNILFKEPCFQVR
jgi:hypothetical protein